MGGRRTIPKAAHPPTIGFGTGGARGGEKPAVGYRNPSDAAL
jgi:hypothetical protein